MRKYLIETSVIVGYLRGKVDVLKKLESLDGELTSSYICLSELYEGVFRVRDKGDEEVSVLNFFLRLSEIYGLDKEIAKEFGKIRANLKKGGNIVEDMDILLAATCIAYGLTMVTLNKGHFERVPGLQLY